MLRGTVLVFLTRLAYCASQHGGDPALLLGRFLPKLGGASMRRHFFRTASISQDRQSRGFGALAAK
jgi:hypothetical protein